MRRRVEPTYAAVVAAGRVLFGALDLQVRVEGAEHLPASGPVVLASNHVSFPDFAFIGRALLGSPRRVRFLCRHDIWDSPAGPWMDRMRHVPVDRAAPAAAYLQARALLREREVVCVFPEAGISAAYVVRGLMPGAVALARETGAPLLPVVTWGGARLWGQRRAPEDPVPSPVPTRHRIVDVRIGAPVRIGPDADLVAETRRLGTRLQEGLEELQALPEHRPRPGERAPWHPVHLGGHAVDRATSLRTEQTPRHAVKPTWGPGL